MLFWAVVLSFACCGVLCRELRFLGGPLRWLAWTHASATAHCIVAKATGCRGWAPMNKRTKVGGMHASMQASRLPQCVSHPLHLALLPHVNHEGVVRSTISAPSLVEMRSCPACSALPLV